MRDLDIGKPVPAGLSELWNLGLDWAGVARSLLLRGTEEREERLGRKRWAAWEVRSSLDKQAKFQR